MKLKGTLSLITTLILGNYSASYADNFKGKRSLYLCEATGQLTAKSLQEGRRGDCKNTSNKSRPSEKTITRILEPAYKQPKQNRNK